jgi:pSer/pThr/pTyr-binding forkhead associated (FHA) protein
MCLKIFRAAIVCPHVYNLFSSTMANRPRLKSKCSTKPKRMGFVVQREISSYTKISENSGRCPDMVMIGRAPLNQIAIDHPTVSAQHAVLLRTGDTYSLKDLNSTNGTQINGDFVTDAELKDGDTIRFGAVVAVFARSDRKPWSSRAVSCQNS